MEAAPHPWPTLGVLLMRDGLVSKDELESILAEQRDARQQRITGRRLGEILIERGRVTPTQVAKLVAEQYELPYVELDAHDVDVRIARRLDEESARRFSAIPINVRPDGSLLLGIADPSTVLFSDELRRLLGAMPQFAVVGPEALAAALDVVYDATNEPASKSVQPIDDVVVAESNGEPPPTFFGPGRAVAHLWPPLGALLVREGLISDAELETALAQQRLSTSHRLGEILVERGVVSPSIIARLVAEQYELPFVELAEHEIDPVVARLLPESMARAYPAVPIARRADGTLEVAIADPTNAFYSDDLHRALGAPVAFVVASPDAIETVVTSVHSGAPPVAQGDAAPAETVAVPTWSDALAPRDDDEDAVLEPEASEQDVTVEERLPEDAYDETEIEATEQQDELVSALLAQAALPDPLEQIEADATQEPEPDTTDEVVEADDEPPAEPVVISLAGPFETVEDPAPDEAEEPAADIEDEGAYADPEPFAPVVELAEPPALPAWLLDETETVSTEENADEAEIETEPPTPILALAPMPETLALVEAPTAEEAETEADEAHEEVEEHVEPEAEVELEAEPEPSEPARASSVVEEALALGATALHVSPRDDALVVRARVDGVVRELGTVAFDERDTLLDELAEAGLDVQVLPTKRGDKITARRTQAEAGPETLDELGLSPEADETLRAALARPLGVTVVCGPTASGVTTTLYAALRELRTNERIVATVERSVARLLDGVDHVEVDTSGDATFASALDSLVGADSDVVLVGELPDAETASAAFRAALSGRRILTSLRMPDAVTALRRLADLGVEPTVVSAALTCVVAQQLVRRVCADCRETYYASESELASLGEAASSTGPRLLVRGRGCPSCSGTGYQGRTGVFEVLPPDGALVDLAASGATLAELERTALELGFRTLRAEATRLCLDGVTTSDELRRVFGSG